MSARTLAGAAGLVCLVALAGCEQTPITLQPQFTPPMGWLQQPAKRGAAKARVEVCRIGLAAIRDIRVDPGSMGSIAYRTLRMPDSAKWFRAGFLALNRDPRLKLSEGTDNADLVMEVEVIKAYVMSITSSKTAAVIFRVRYSKQGTTIDEKFYRGGDVNWNWNSGEGESQSVLDATMADALKQIDRDAVARCAKDWVPPPVPVTPAPVAPTPAPVTPPVPATTPTPAAVPPATPSAVIAPAPVTTPAPAAAPAPAVAPAPAK